MESLNILVYRSCTHNAERNYYLNKLSSAHGEQDMAKTLRALQAYMQEHQPNWTCAGCITNFVIWDMIDKDIKLLLHTGIDENVLMNNADGGLKELLRAENLSIDDVL